MLTIKDFTLITTVVIVSFTMLVPATGQDWPQWRGQNRDGSVLSFLEPTTWPEELIEQWKMDVGLGYSTPILIEESVYIFTRQGNDEVMRAIDADSGVLIWQTSYPAIFDMNPGTARHGGGPKSTPVFDNGRLFTLGISGIVTAFDAKTGQRLWQQQPASPLEPLYHTAFSPVVDGGFVIFHVGGHDDGALTAFDVTTGEVKWTWTGDGPAYGSPVVVELDETRQIVLFTQEHLVGIEIDTGKLLWKRPFTTPYTTTSQTPIIYGDIVVEAGRANGITAFRAERLRDQENWITEDLWHTDDVSMHMSNGVAIDNVLFGLSHLNSGQYFSLDLDTGSVLWQSEPRQAENASILRSGETIFVLENDAELVIVQNSRSGFEPLIRYDVATSETWTQPAISGKRFFVKDVSSLTLLTLE